MLTQDAWMFTCPQCGADLCPPTCLSCGHSYLRTDGIWRLLQPDALERFRAFLSDYTKIRSSEGCGSSQREHLMALPAVSSDDPNAGIWRLRQSSYHILCRRVLPPLGHPLRIVDLGAGVGWLSYRLSKLGHLPCAIDINIHNEEGLGAARHYDPKWPCIQAEFDRIPLTSASVDLVIFNASFHYSTDYRVTLREALRVVRPGGAVVILDSPIYRDGSSGLRMVAERQANFEKKFGTKSDALSCIQFLTWAAIEALARDLNLQHQVIRPWWGVKWALRPLIARLRGTREPAQFAILTYAK